MRKVIHEEDRISQNIVYIKIVQYLSVASLYYNSLLHKAVSAQVTIALAISATAIENLAGTYPSFIFQPQFSYFWKQLQYSNNSRYTVLSGSYK